MRLQFKVSQNVSAAGPHLRTGFIGLALVALTAFGLHLTQATAAPLPQGLHFVAAKESPDIVQIRVRGRGGAVAGRGGGVAWRGHGGAWHGGGARYGHGTAWRGGGYYRGGYYRGGGAVAWRRPSNYWWPAGGAIAAGAATGFLTAGAAAAYAGPAPAPGYCWYYTDPSRRQGFWDVCQ